MKRLLSSLLIVSILFLLTPHAAYAAGVALDNAEATYTGGTSGTSYSFTVTGSNTVLVLAVGTDSGSGISATYNGVTIPQIIQSIPTSPCGLYETLFYLAGPATGSHTVSVSGGGTLFYHGTASYSGASQLSTPDNSNQNTQSPLTTITNTINSVADNSWHVAIFNSGSAGQSANTGTQRAISSNAAWGVYDNNSAIHPAGSNTLIVNQTNQCGNSTSVTIAPFVASVSCVWCKLLDLI